MSSQTQDLKWYLQKSYPLFVSLFQTKFVGIYSANAMRLKGEEWCIN